MQITRREFVAAGAATALMSGFSWASEQPLPLAFSTLGCPGWEWKKVLDYAQANGFAAVELRGIMGQMDLPSRPEFAPAQIAASKRQVADHGLKISDLGCSAEMHVSDPTDRAKQLADARRFIDLASTLEVPYVRVFGNQIKGPREEVALLWDAHHTYVDGHEQPEHTVAELGPWIRHTHLKDSIQVGKDRKYVLPGTGDVPMERQIMALRKIGYKGYYCFEWEKVWHPDIQEPEVAFPAYVKLATAYLKEPLKKA
jgi:sugar phosphate isomerase/epimerase